MDCRSFLASLILGAGIITGGCTQSTASPAAAADGPLNNPRFCQALGASGDCTTGFSEFSSGVKTIYASIDISKVAQPQITYKFYLTQSGGAKQQFANGSLPVQTTSSGLADGSVTATIKEATGIASGNYEWDVAVIGSGGQSATTVATFTVD